MKAVTLYQPWASAIFTLRDDAFASGNENGFIKTVETRKWAMFYRGDIAIHAGKEFGADRDEKLHACDLARQWGFDPILMPRSVVLGVVRVDLCVKFPCDKMPGEMYHGANTGDFSRGRWGWKLRVIEIFATPIPARGARLLWNWVDPRDTSRERTGCDSLQPRRTEKENRP